MDDDDTEKELMGYGHETWQSPEVTPEKALGELKSLDDQSFEVLKAMIKFDLEEGNIHEGAVSSHIRQVDCIGLLIAENSNTFTSREEKMLIELEFLLHDIEKKPNPYSLKTHAFESASNVAPYIKNISSVNRPSEVNARFEVALQSNPRLNEFLQNCDNTLLFLAKSIETHSDMPFIENLEKHIPLKKEGKEVFIDYRWLEEIPEEALPYLVRKEKDGQTYFGLPEPKDIGSKLLRSADTLSNYAVIPTLNLEGYKDKYAGFIKLMGLTSGNTQSEKIESIIVTAVDALNYGVYDEFPFAKEQAIESIERMKWLKEYWTDRPEPKSQEEKQIEYEKMFDLLEQNELEKV